MDRDERASGTDSGWALPLLGAVLEIIGAVVGGGSQRRNQYDVEYVGDTGFDHEVSAGDGYTMYGCEPVVAGRNGEPVGAYSGAPILHY